MSKDKGEQNMVSKQSMFDQIKVLRKECNKPFEKVELYQIMNLWRIYSSSRKNIEFREKAKTYLGW